MNLRINYGKLAQSVKRRGTLKILSVSLAGIALIAGTLCVTGFGPRHYQLGGAWVGGNPAYNTAALNYTLDVYPPSADADGDGFPDAGATPALSIPTVDNGRRVPIL